MLWLSDDFVSDIIKGNYVQKEITGQKKQGNLIDNVEGKTLLEQELKKKIFKLGEGAINNILKRATEEKIITQNLQSLEAAELYIKELQQNNKKYTPTAIVKTAIEEGWVPQSNDINKEEVNELSKDIENWGKAENAGNQKQFNDFLYVIKTRIGDRAYRSWFKINLKSIDKSIEFETNSNFIKDELENKYGELIGNTCEKVFSNNNFKLVVKKA